MLAFFLGKCVRTTTKTMVLDRKKLEGTSSAIFGVRTAAKCCELKRRVDRVRSRTDNKGEVLEGKFSNLNFSPSTKKTTEYSFQLFLSIYRYLKFFLKFLTSLLSNWIVLLCFFKSDVVHVISRQVQRRLPRSTAQFPAKKKWRSPRPSGCLEAPPPPPPGPVWVYVRWHHNQYSAVQSKLLHMDRVHLTAKKGGGPFF